jgi:hypothetical protein
MKNIHVLQKNVLNQLGVDHYGKTPTQIKIEEYLINKNIYITSDEEIKEGDWCFYVNGVYKVLKISSNKRPVIKMSDGTFEISYYKKIILTTDQDLIKDGVQAIDDEFLEWFVKNPSCEEVEVLRYKNIGYRVYPLIIQKEESKQETLEEAASIFSKQFLDNGNNSEFEAQAAYLGFIQCAKWQQEQDKNKFSGEDVPNNLESVLAKITHQNDLGLSQWHEVVYYDNETEKWCCYSGSKTFQDGERVVDWKYCKDCL